VVGAGRSGHEDAPAGVGIGPGGTCPVPTGPGEQLVASLSWVLDPGAALADADLSAHDAVIGGVLGVALARIFAWSGRP
jgi:hypothetical protein